MVSRGTTSLAATIIALAALGVPVLRYAMAFQQAEPPLVAWGFRLDISPLTGLLFGASFEAAAFLGFQAAAAARRRGLKTWWWPLASAAAQLALGSIIVAPVLAAELHNQELAILLGPTGCWLWSATVVAACPLTLATVSLVLVVQPAARQHNADSTSSERAKPRSKRFTCGQCGAGFGSQQALNAHQRVHTMSIVPEEEVNDQP